MGNDKGINLESQGDGMELSRKGTKIECGSEMGLVESFRMQLATEDKNLTEHLAWISDVEVIEVLIEDRGMNKLFRGMRLSRKE